LLAGDGAADDLHIFVTRRSYRFDQPLQGHASLPLRGNRLAASAGGAALAIIKQDVEQPGSALPLVLNGEACAR
jgi:hypothetical protein